MATKNYRKEVIGREDTGRKKRRERVDEEILGLVCAPL